MLSDAMTKQRPNEFKFKNFDGLPLPFEELYASDSQFESEFLEYKYPNSLTGMDSENLTLPDECGLIISDHTKQHCRNKR